MSTSAPASAPLPQTRNAFDAAELPPQRNASSSPRFILVAGEASGDLLGAYLIAGLKRRFPLAGFAGVGGPKMRAAGMEIWYACDQLSVMGLVEVLRHLPRLLRLRRDVLKRTLEAQPDAFIGIDAPDFNLGLEKRLKRGGIRTVHYVSPSIWAWKEKRATTIGQSADRVLCLFPMEPPIYARHGTDAQFVGHPLAEAFAVAPDKQAARITLHLPVDVPVLAVLPGSRLGEIARLGSDFLAAARLLKRQFPQLHIVAPMANPQCRDAFARLIAASDFGRETVVSESSGSPSFTILDGNAHAAMVAADAVLLASGTAALEALLAKRPMVVAYRVAPLTYRLVQWLGLLKTSVYSLPNILAGRTLVPELMQEACTPKSLADALAPMLRERALAADTLQAFVNIHESLRGDAEHNAAAAIADLIARA